MSSIFSILVCAVVACPPAADTGSSPNKSRKQTLSELINRFSGNDYTQRERASTDLTNWGPDALPELLKLKKHPDPEVHRRLDEIIPVLERTAVLSPKLVSLHMTNRPVREILNELGKQTGYKIIMWPENPPPGERDKVVYTFHFDKLPFWEALDRICESSGMVFMQGYWGDDALRFNQQDGFVPFNSYIGPFKVVATGFTYNRNNTFGQQLRRVGRQMVQAENQNFENLSINLQIATEPRLPLLKVGRPTLTFAEDEEKHSLIPPQQVANQFGYQAYYGWWYRSSFQQTQTNLIWPSKSAKVVKVMRGVIPVTLLADQKPTVVSDKILSAKGKQLNAAGATFTIDDIKTMPGKQYQISMSVTEDNKDAPNDYSRIQSLQQRLELQDEKGNKYPAYINVMNWGGPNNAQFQLVTQNGNNQKIGPPAKLLYYAWVLMEHEVAFEFKDLPLP